MKADNEAVRGFGDRYYLARSEIIRSVPRWTLLLLLLGAELTLLRFPLGAFSAPVRVSGWYWLIILPTYQALIVGIVGTFILSWPVPAHALLRALTDSQMRWLARVPWLIAHVVFVCISFAVLAHLRIHPLSSTAKPEPRLLLWRVLLLPVFVTWMAAALPTRFWIEWFTRSWRAFLQGAILGLVVELTGQALWWSPLQRATFRTVALLLRLSGKTAIASPQQLIIGTPDFSVQIWPRCSGLEGIVLIGTFIAGYLWFFRRELRFPHAFVLLPVGIILSWFLNSVRIAVLILIGGTYPAAAWQGFHSVAGWIFFNLVACGLLWLSWRLGLLAKPIKTDLGTKGIHIPNPADVYLVPLLAVMSVALVTLVVPSEFELLYPFRVLVAAVAFWFYRRELLLLRWDPSFNSVALGAIVFLLWIALAHPSRSPDIAHSIGFRGMSGLATAAWLIFRTAGSVITVPLAEELAFRGYLIRKLVASDFVSVPPGQFTWVSFLGSSILFGAFHSQWVAGIMAGMIFAAALYRRGYLSDAVLAHSTANGLLSAYVLATGTWSLWN
jgi:exosortase E/protease (VPEID-CTERM system)